MISRLVSVDADLEYALQDGKFWMPYRQAIAGRVQVPMLGDLTIPFRAVTTFSDYELNSRRPIAFTLPLPDTTLPWDSVRVLRRMRRDSIQAERLQRNSAAARRRSWDYADRWHGGRYEIHRPSNDSLAQYASWEAPLTYGSADADLGAVRSRTNGSTRMPFVTTGYRDTRWGSGITRGCRASSSATWWGRYGTGSPTTG
jgi:hypothetical protein